MKTTVKSRLPKPVKLYPPGPLQTSILEYLKTKGRASAQELETHTETTLGSVRDALSTLRKRGLVVKSPVSFELAECCRAPKKAKKVQSVPGN